LFNQTFYFSLIRKYVSYIGTLFADINIVNTDANNNVSGIISVPVMYGPKDKMLSRVVEDPSISRPSATLPLPMISFELGEIRYDGDRKLPTTNRVVISKDPNHFSYQYVPVPYNIDFKVYVYIKNVEDGTKIMEQILPYFTPDWTTSLILIPEMDIIMDIPVVLTKINYNDKYAGDLKNHRTIVWELDLELKGYFYGPVKTNGVIKFTNVNFYIPNSNVCPIEDAVGITPIAEKMTETVGLTANGLPTSNASNSIPWNQINANSLSFGLNCAVFIPTSDYGFIETIINEY